MYKLLMAAILWVCTVLPLWSMTVEERLLAGLQGQGYTIIEKGYTFLGRLRIVAENAEIHREIVVNPGTGEILRDYAIYLSDIARSRPSVANLDKADSKPADQTATAAPTDTVKAGAADQGSTGITVSSVATSSATLDAAGGQPDVGASVAGTTVAGTTVAGTTVAATTVAGASVAGASVAGTSVTDPLLDATLLPMSPETP